MHFIHIKQCKYNCTFLLACRAGGFVCQTHKQTKWSVKLHEKWHFALVGLVFSKPPSLKFLLSCHLATNSFGLGRPFHKSSHKLQDFRCHHNQNGRNLEGCSLNSFCVRATKQPAMPAIFLLELFENIKSLNHCSLKFIQVY